MVSTLVKEKLLFISYYFPPTKSIASVRAFNIASELTKDYELCIFTTNNQKGFLHDIYPPLQFKKIKHLKTVDPRSAFKKRPLKSKISENKGISLIYKLLNSFPGNIILGIGGLVYIFHGTYIGLKKKKVDVIYSSYFPYCDHIIAYLIKKFNPKVKWVCDFRDLHYAPDSKELIFLNLQKWFNRKIIAKADIVTTVSEGLKRHLLPFNNNTVVVRNAIGEINKLRKEITRFQDKFTLGYTGNLIPGKSNPESLFIAIKSLITSSLIDSSNFQFTAVGNYNETWKKYAKSYGCANILDARPAVSLKKSFEVQTMSDLNILLSFNSSQTKGILTGKFYEYLAAKKPILLIINGVQDPEFEAIFKELNCGLIVYHNASSTIEKIKNFITHLINLKQRKIPYLYTMENYHKYMMSFQLSKVISFLKNQYKNPSF